MDGYKRFAAICCLMAILTFKDADAAVTEFSQVIAAAGVTKTNALAGGTITDLTTLTVAEDFGSGTISTFTATGSDGSGAWTTDAGAVSTTGAFSMSTLDFETADSHTVTIKFTELTVVNTVTLTLAVTDVVLAFTPATYAETVTDGSGAGTTVTTVTAADVATYVVEAAGNTDTVFEVSSTGVITIATGKTVDRATLKGYALTVLAKDSGTFGSTQKTVTATVPIGVCPSTAAAVVTSVAVILLTAGVTILS